VQTTKGLRDRGIIAGLLGCAYGAGPSWLTDGRSSGGFTPEATVAAGRANTPELSVWRLRSRWIIRALVGFGRSCSACCRRLFSTSS